MKQFLATATFTSLLAFASFASASDETSGLSGGDTAATTTTTTSSAANGTITKFEQTQINGASSTAEGESSSSSLTDELLALLGLAGVEG